MKAIGIIPARLNSQRFPEKLLAPLKEKSVIERTIEKAKTYPLEKIFIATDSEKISSLASSLGVPVLVTSSKPQSGTERIVEALDSYPELYQNDIIFNLQGDHPFTSPTTIDQILSFFRVSNETLIGTAVVPIQDTKAIYSPHVVKCVFDRNSNALYFSRSAIPHPVNQNVKSLFYQHLGIYAFRSSLLKRYNQLSKSNLELVENLEQLRFLENGIPIKVAIVNDIPQGIDTPQDLKECEKWVTL
jgi:3-deoxy-manno-octulosonate cytidylyltransferase (CMP-KDO synthetase)